MEFKPRVAEARYKMGFTKEAHQTRQETLKGISTVRHFLDKSHLIAPEKISAFAKRCDELEILVKGVGPNEETDSPTARWNDRRRTRHQFEKATL